MAAEGEERGGFSNLIDCSFRSLNFSPFKYDCRKLCVYLQYLRQCFWCRFLLASSVVLVAIGDTAIDFILTGILGCGLDILGVKLDVCTLTDLLGKLVYMYTVLCLPAHPEGTVMSGQCLGML